MHRCGLARDGGLLEPTRLEVAEIAPKRAGVEVGGHRAAAAFAPRDELVDIVRVRAARVFADTGERRREAAGIVTRVLCHEHTTVVVRSPATVTCCRTPAVACVRRR